jgi:hypothetical protein
MGPAARRNRRMVSEGGPTPNAKSLFDGELEKQFIRTDAEVFRQHVKLLDVKKTVCCYPDMKHPSLLRLRSGSLASSCGVTGMTLKLIWSIVVCVGAVAAVTAASQRKPQPPANQPAEPSRAAERSREARERLDELRKAVNEMLAGNAEQARVYFRRMATESEDPLQRLEGHRLLATSYRLERNVPDATRALADAQAIDDALPFLREQFPHLEGALLMDRADLPVFAKDEPEAAIALDDAVVSLGPGRSPQGQRTSRW